jgi:hypothetical protein
MYFYGFACGIILFMMPEFLGRKGAMKVLLPPFILASTLSVYGQTISTKSCGFFIQGFLHLKIMLSYTHIFELVQKDHKSFCATFINCLDSLTFASHGLYYLFVSRDGVQYLRNMHLIGTFGTILYFILIPESPRWLF